MAQGQSPGPLPSIQGAFTTCPSTLTATRLPCGPRVLSAFWRMRAQPPPHPHPHQQQQALSLQLKAFLGHAWEGMIAFGAHLFWLPVLLVLLYLGPSPTQGGTSRGKG